MLPLSVLLLVLLRAKVIDEETSVKPPRNYPTPGAPPLSQGWFHRTPIHTILHERLGIKRIAMKHITLTAVSLLLIGLTMSGIAYSQVPSWEREALIALYNATDGSPSCHFP